MNLDIKDKIIIVTGGSRGIGGGIVALLAEEGAFPVIGLIFVGLLIAFVTARIISIWSSIKKPILYALAGGSALLAIVVLMPLVFYNLDLIAGARTLTGKVYLICAGILAGYYFGSHPAKGVSNEI
jgi:hypothetical protein